MDILTHGLSGIAVASAIAPLGTRTTITRGLVLGCGLVGGILPDIDSISRWSRFDDTIGRRLSLSESGRDIYFGDHWYSHHNFTHSIVGALFFAFVLLIIIGSFSWRNKAVATCCRTQGPIKPLILFPAALFVGSLAHLLGDLPTPACVWGGIKLWWPIQIEVGGIGNIWSWNNYDLFMIAFSCVTVNLVFLIVGVFIRGRSLAMMPAIIVILSFVIMVIQIKNREQDFAYEGFTPKHTAFERASLRYQNEHLPRPLYRSLRRFDRILPFPF